MSGLDILGAVAASLQLLDTCSAIGRLLCKMPADGKMVDKVEFNCNHLLKGISASLVESSPDFFWPAQSLAEELQSIRVTIERRKRHKFWRSLGSGDEYRKQLLVAIDMYICAATLSMTGTMQKLCTGQSGSSREILEKFSILSNEFQNLNDKTSEMKTILEGVTKVGTQEEIREELAAARNQQPIIAILGGQNLSGGITPELGTMGEYLGEIWRTGSATSDQDIWECYYDIVSVYINHEFPVCARFGFSRPRGSLLGECSERKGLLGARPHSSQFSVDFLGCFKRILCSDGTRRFRGEYVVLPHHHSLIPNLDTIRLPQVRVRPRRGCT